MSMEDDFIPDDLHDIEARFQQIEHEFQEDSRDAEQYLEELNLGVDAALAADGFFLLTVHRGEVDGMELWVPGLFASSISEAAIQVMRAQIIQTAATSYQQHIMTILRKLQEDED